ncbi:MAG TPA: EAL domain-containing protein, partial [Acidimicrobiales bacterium]|nr:EAL domain-containing protein [Acidimicrobiales bacterium]
EGALMSDGESIEATLEELRSLGVRLAIDDFGTGWSSLSRLREFPVDKLKIDRAFVREITSPTDDVPLVAAIVAMASSLGLTVVAEGVETLEQLAALHALGCEEVQGYLLSRPVTAEALEALLAEPVGLLDGPSATVSAQRRSLEEREFMGMVASATASPSPDSSLVRTMLAELQRVSDLDSVYLSMRHPERGAQEVKVTANGPRLVVPQGMVTPWRGSPCAAMLDGGPHVTTDMRVDFPAHALTRIGVVGHVTVPVRDASGEIYGTLCGATTSPLNAGAGTVVLLELFASLVGDHVRVAGTLELAAR